MFYDLNDVRIILYLAHLSFSTMCYEDELSSDVHVHFLGMEHRSVT